jgi:hypothetical protein
MMAGTEVLEVTEALQGGEQGAKFHCTGGQAALSLPVAQQLSWQTVQ